MNLEECREWIRQHQADSDDDAARALLSLLASKTDREERARLRAIVGAAYEHENARHQEAYKRACARLWQAFATYQEWQDDNGDADTFASWAREEIPNLMPVDGG